MRYFATTKLVLAGAILMALPFLLFWQIWWPNSEHRLVFTQGDFVSYTWPDLIFQASQMAKASFLKGFSVYGLLAIFLVYSIAIILALNFVT